MSGWLRPLHMGGRAPSAPALLAVWWSWNLVLAASGLRVEQRQVRAMVWSRGPRVLWNGPVRVRAREERP